MKHGTIRFWTHEPDYSDLPSKEHEWFPIYGEVTEMLPGAAPDPLGKPITLTHYVDANLFYDALTGYSVLALFIC